MRPFWPLDCADAECEMHNMANHIAHQQIGHWTWIKLGYQESDTEAWKNIFNFWVPINGSEIFIQYIPRVKLLPMSMMSYKMF